MITQHRTWTMYSLLAACVAVGGADSAQSAKVPGAPAWTGPSLVSPGGNRREGRVGTACPTFSWSLIPEAQRYELTIYEVEGSGEELGRPDEPLHRIELPAGVTSWTPDLGDCLPLGRYGWAVAAIHTRAGGDERRWSKPAIFRVESGPTAPAEHRRPGFFESKPALAPEEPYALPSSSAFAGEPPRSMTAAAIVTPPDCNPSSLAFTDVPATSLFCRWIEQAARDGISAGCGGGKYCPALPVTREQVAMLLEKARGTTVLAYKTVIDGPALSTTPAEVTGLQVTFTLDVDRTVLIDFGGTMAVQADANNTGAVGNTASLSLERDLTQGLGTVLGGGYGAVINASVARMVAPTLTAGTHTLRVYADKSSATFNAAVSRLFIRVMLP